MMLGGPEVEICKDYGGNFECPMPVHMSVLPVVETFNLWPGWHPVIPILLAFKKN